MAEINKEIRPLESLPKKVHGKGHTLVAYSYDTQNGQKWSMSAKWLFTRAQWVNNNDSEEWLKQYKKFVTAINNNDRAAIDDGYKYFLYTRSMRKALI